MDVKDNLKPVRSKDEARERGRKGGIASGEARRQKKTMAQALRQMVYEGKLNETTKAMLKADGIEEMTHQMVITRSLIAKAEAGDVQAYNAICAMLGESPANKVEMSGGMEQEIKIRYVGEDGDDVFPSSESEVEL